MNLKSKTKIKFENLVKFFSAFSCILPQATDDPTQGYSYNRWYYNSITGVCQQFKWLQDGSKANSNNFLTQEQCLSYCAFNCRRGLSQYSNAQKIIEQTSVTCTVGQCPTNHECKTYGTSARCCPRPSKLHIIHIFSFIHSLFSVFKAFEMP